MFSFMYILRLIVDLFNITVPTVQFYATQCGIRNDRMIING